MEIGNFGRKASPQWTEEDTSESDLDFEEGILKILPGELFVYGTSNDDTVRKISSDGQIEEWVFDGFDSTVYDVAVDVDGFIYAGSGDDTVRKIEPNGSEEWVFDGFTDMVRGVAVDPGTISAFPGEY